MICGCPVNQCQKIRQSKWQRKGTRKCPQNFLNPDLILRCNDLILGFNDSMLGCNDLLSGFNDSILGFNDSILGFNNSILRCNDSILKLNDSILRCSDSILECNDSILELLFTVAFFSRACVHGEVYVPLTFTDKITNGIKE